MQVCPGNGKATKRSRYGSLSKDRMRRTIWSAELCSKAGLTYHLIDSEWKKFYLMPYEAQELINHSKDLKTIFTFSTRHNNSLRLLKQTLEDIDTSKVGLTLVPGNPAYLSTKEARKSGLKSLRIASEFVRRHFEDLDVFIGSEGLGPKIAELCAEYDLTPFLLLDKGFEEEIVKMKDVAKNHNFGLYIPYLISENYPRLLRDILFRLSGYVMRRRWVKEELKRMGYDPAISTLRAVIQEKKPLPSNFYESELGVFLEKAASYLTLYGNVDTVTKKLKEIHKAGVTTVMGLPIKENADQILQFGKCSVKIS